MKRLLAILLLFFFLIPSSEALAQKSTDAMMYRPPTPGGTALFGQTHAYSVTFRGNGEAVVAARITITNQEDGPLSQINLRVPRVTPTDILAFQILREAQCIRYEPATTPMNQPACAEYQEPDYTTPYWYGQNKYQKASVALSTDTVEVTLPRSIKSQGSGAFLLYYRASGYAKKNLLGAYAFAFPTLQVEDTINEATIGITTDSELILKGAKGSVTYRVEDAGVAMKSNQMEAAPMPTLDRVSQTIGQGTITKKATNLQPLDYYTATGMYADSRLKLYAKESGVAMAVVLGILLGIFIIIKAILGRIQGVTANPTLKVASSSPLADTILLVGLSFIAAFLGTIAVVGIILLNQLVTMAMPYGTAGMTTILILLIGFLLVGTLFFTPAILMGWKRGVGRGIVTFGLTVLWLLIFGLVLLAFLLMGSATGYQGGGPIQIMKNMMGTNQTSTDSVRTIEAQPPSLNPSSR